MPGTKMVRTDDEKTNGSVNLDYVVKNLKNKQKVFNMSDYFHLLQLTVDAVSEISLTTLDTIEVAYFTVGDTNAIELPNDYLDYTKISFLDCAGNKWTLTLNDDLVRYPIKQCGVPLDRVLGGFCEQFPAQFPLPDNGYYFGEGFHYGNTSPVYYSLGGGFNKGYYKIDRQGRYLLIQGLPKGTVVCLEYKSTGIKLGSTTYIARQAMPAVQAHVMWTEQKFDNIQTNTNWEKEFYTAEGLLSNLEYTRTYQEHLDGLYREWHQGAKR